MAIPLPQPVIIWTQLELSTKRRMFYRGCDRELGYTDTERPRDDGVISACTLGYFLETGVPKGTVPSAIIFAALGLLRSALASTRIALTSESMDTQNGETNPNDGIRFPYRVGLAVTCISETAERMTSPELRKEDDRPRGGPAAAHQYRIAFKPRLGPEPDPSLTDRQSGRAQDICGPSPPKPTRPDPHITTGEATGDRKDVLSSRSLAIERRRWKERGKKVAPQQWRLCRFCYIYVEDPAHAMFRCEHAEFKEIRQVFFDKLDEHFPVLGNNS
ncbi:hypothetical protein B0H10DRAFT_2187610 [Mycena sp. CBHHK59/15]|nr:hypothetical protein B0H10DRAFT_2187610 [Mycena sp. CBHHK59/15]